MRQIVLDTETTGLEPALGHRIIEIGGVELVNRRCTGRNLHHYLNPERDIDEAALDVHGITRAFLADKPRFTDVAAELLDYLRGSELVIHNADFDLGFLNHELALVDPALDRIEDLCSVVDTLAMARRAHPGQRNSLDALCKRYHIDNSSRTLHGALLDAEILADVYLAMTGGQITLLGDLLDATGDDQAASAIGTAPLTPTRIVAADPDERAAHEKWLQLLEVESGNRCVWREIES